MPIATFQPFGTRVAVNPDESLYEAGRRAGVPIPTACNGKGTCGLCRVKILTGAEALPPLTVEEKKHLGNTYFISRLRLSCRVRPTADVEVLLPDAARALAGRDPAR